MEKVDRRTVLTGALASMVGMQAVTAAATPTKAPAFIKGLPDFVVVGAGAFGVWTALTLRELGAKVTLLDCYGPGNPLASSSDDTRELRRSYGSREMYTQWATTALDLWKQREDEWGRQFFFQSGMLTLASDWNDELKAQRSIFDKYGIPYEVLKTPELTYRFPQVDFEGTPPRDITPLGGTRGSAEPKGIGMAFYEPGSGLLKAREGINAAAESFRRKGGVLRIGRAMPGRASGGKLLDVDIGGSPLSAGNFVFACGPWLPRIFPALLGDKILTPRAEVFYFRTPPNDDRFRAGNMPTLADVGGYGSLIAFTQGDLDTGLKCSIAGESVLMNPDDDERVVSDYKIHRTRLYLKARVPALANQPIVSARVCQVEMTRNENFIIDNHPDYSNLLIAGGGSAHGFKHGPMTGRYISDLLLGRPVNPQWKDTFKLAGRESW